MEILTKYEDELPPCIVHCFTGTEDEIKAYVGKGFWIGLTGEKGQSVFVLQDGRDYKY